MQFRISMHVVNMNFNFSKLVRNKNINIEWIEEES